MSQWAKAVFAYAGQEEDELTFKAGDIIEIIEEEEGEAEEGWSFGALNGREGIFPSNYIEMLDGKPETTVSQQKVKVEDTKAKDEPASKSSAEKRKPKKIGMGWYEVFDEASSRVYYVHKKDKRKQWTWPDEVPRPGADAPEPPSAPKPPSAPPTIAPPSKDTKVESMGPRPDFSSGDVTRTDRNDFIIETFMAIDEEFKLKHKDKPIWRKEGGREIADFSFMKTNKIGVGARRQFRLEKERGNLTLRKKNKDAKRFHISRVKACEKVKGESKTCMLVFGKDTGRGGSKKKKQRPYVLEFESKRQMERFQTAVREMISIRNAVKQTKTGLMRNVSTYVGPNAAAGSASTRNFSAVNMRQNSFMSQKSLAHLSGIDLLSNDSSGSAAGGDGATADTLTTSFKIVKTNKLGINQERILEFVPLAATARKDVNAEGGMEMRVSTLRGEKKKGFDVDFITSVVKDPSSDCKLDLLFGAPFYYTMMKTLAYIESEQQRPYLLEFTDGADRSEFCKTLLWAQNASRQSYRIWDMKKKEERLRDMNTTLWHVSYKSKGRWEPHELYWRAPSGVVSGRIAIIANETQEVACRFDSSALKGLIALDQTTQPLGAPPSAVACRLRAEHKGKSRNLDIIFVDGNALSSFVAFARKTLAEVKVDDEIDRLCKEAEEEDDDEYN